MTNREIAAVLFNISAILSAQHGNPYRIRAYRRAARNVLRSRGSIAARVAAGKSLGIPQLGKSLTAKIRTLASEGRLPFYEQLCAELPATQQTLLKVPGLGPTIAARIHRDLGPADANGLRHAAISGALQRVWGIGPKRTAAILDTLGGQRVRQEQMEI
jgi:DNA polymerase/3'-5' exonuclease PolX